jgi:hypothetical protein
MYMSYMLAGVVAAAIGIPPAAAWVKSYFNTYLHVFPLIVSMSFVIAIFVLWLFSPDITLSMRLLRCYWPVPLLPCGWHHRSHQGLPRYQMAALPFGTTFELALRSSFFVAMKWHHSWYVTCDHRLCWSPPRFSHPCRFSHSSWPLRPLLRL